MSKKEVREAMRKADALKDKIVEVLEEVNPELQILMSVLMSMTVQTGLEGMNIAPQDLIHVFAKGVCTYHDDMEEAEEESTTTNEGENDEQAISRTTH